MSTREILQALAGLVFVLWGVELYRRALWGVFFCLGAAVAELLCASIGASGASRSASLLAMLLGGLCSAGLARTRLAPLGGLLLGCGAAALLATPYAAALGVPPAVVGLVFVVGGSVAPFVFLGTLGAGLVAPALAPWVHPLVTWVALLLLAARAGLAAAVQPVEISPRVLGACATLGQRAALDELVLAPRPGQAAALARALQRSGARTELVPGSIIIASNVSRAMVESWRGPFAPLLALAAPTRAVPLRVESGDLVLTLPEPKLTPKGPPASLERVQAEVRREDDPTGKGIVVAVVDTGVNAVTPAIKKALTKRLDFTDEGTPEDRGSGHGTSVAACVIAGAGGEVGIVSIKVLDRRGSGTLVDYLRGLKAVEELARRGEVHLANLSLGADSCRGANTCFFCTATAGLSIPVVASIGNEGRAGPCCPGGSSSTLGVGAITFPERECTSWSSRGPAGDGRSQPDVTCFGDSLLLPGRDGKLESRSGSSFSSPLAAGCTAAVLSEAKRRGTSLKRDEFFDLMRRSADATGLEPADPNAIGAGLTTVTRAVAALRGERLPALAEPIVLSWPQAVVRAAAVLAAAGMGLRAWMLL